MTNRTYMDIDNYQNFDINDFIDNCVEPNIHISDNENELQKHVIPALVPPLKLKPVLSSKYIEKWHEAASWIKEAGKLSLLVILLVLQMIILMILYVKIMQESEFILLRQM